MRRDFAFLPCFFACVLCVFLLKFSTACVFISGAILVLHFHFRGIFVSKLFFGLLFHNSGSNWDFSFLLVGVV